MNLSQLFQIVRRPKKRVGRGHGSGKVKTSGRGTKGQKARGRVARGFEGGQLPLIKRLPLLRGKLRNRSLKPTPFALAIGKLSKLPKGSIVTMDLLKKHNLVDVSVMRVKLVGGGRLTTSLTVRVPVSQSAQKAIEASGGTVS